MKFFSVVGLPGFERNHDCLFFWQVNISLVVSSLLFSIRPCTWALLNHREYCFCHFLFKVGQDNYCRLNRRMSMQALFGTHPHRTENRRVEERAWSRDGERLYKVFLPLNVFFSFDALNRKEKGDYFPLIRLVLCLMLWQRETWWEEEEKEEKEKKRRNIIEILLIYNSFHIYFVPTAKKVTIDLA